MGTERRPRTLRPQKASEHDARHLWFWVLLLVVTAVLALCGRSASAQTNRVEEIIERALALKPDLADGADLYRRHCATCHGRKAYGDSGTVTPALAGQRTPYLIKQLADVTEGHRQLPEMHRQLARTDLSTPQALRNIATYLNELPTLAHPEIGDGKRLELGERIYKSACAECHGERGEGISANIAPAVRGQHYSYLLMQARRLAEGHRYSVDFSVIALLELLSVDQLTAVADFMSRLPVSLKPSRPLASAGLPMERRRD